MNKGYIYPFKITITDPELANVLRIVSQRRSAKLPNKKVAIRAGFALQPIRKDIHIGPDSKIKRSLISLLPDMDLECKPRSNGYDFIFKHIF